MELGGEGLQRLGSGVRPESRQTGVREVLPFAVRTRWSNDLGNQSIEPLRLYAPATVGELRRVVVEAERVGTTVRAVGSGHSWSDVALTRGFAVLPDRLRAPLDLEPELMLPREATAPPLVRVESGITIEDLNEHLRSLGLALPNMGGFDGQTIAGATSTSTHGSGMGFGPLSDLIVSLDVVGSGGRTYRIERAGGPTDPVLYRRAHPDREIVKDDRWFRAAVVGMGSMGLIHSVVLAVRPAFHLREVRTLSTWEDVREQLRRGDVLRANQHFEVLFSPYRNGRGQIECLVTTRNEIPAAQYRNDWRRSRNFLVELLARFPLTPWIIRTAANLFPSISPWLLHLSLTGLVNPDYVNSSEKVFNIGAANYLPAFSGEIAVPMDARNLHLRAVDEIIDVAEQHRRLGGTYQSSPISLRFVRGTDSYMSMMEGRDTMTIELIQLDGVRGGRELVADYEDRLFERCEGRPHWGQLNHLTRARIERLYPRLRDWLAVERRLNSSGVFDSPFTQRTGLDERAAG